jgi:tetratricopeptide (TPR) repeat protein
MAKGDVAEAEKVYVVLATRDNKLAAPQLRLAMLQQQQGKIDAAIKSYQSVIKADPKSALAYNNLAWLLSNQKKNYSEAELMALKAVELAPEAAQFQDTLGWIYRANGKLVEARAVMEKAVQLAPDDAGINVHSGIVLKESGEHTKGQ